MAIENAIVAMAMHTFIHTSDFVNKTLQVPKPVQGTASSKHVSGKVAKCNLENLAVIRSSCCNKQIQYSKTYVWRAA